MSSEEEKEVLKFRELLVHGHIEHALMCVKYAKNIHDAHYAAGIVRTLASNLEESLADRLPLKKP